MFWRVDHEPDLERSAGQEDLQFDDPSWIIDHHRRNIILKISKPEGASSIKSGNIASPLNAQVHVESKNASDHDQRQIEHSYRINFSELQRLYLRQLQHKLIQHAVDLRYNASEPAGWAEDLRQYGKASLILPRHPVSLYAKLPHSTSAARLRLHGQTYPTFQGSVLRNRRTVHRALHVASRYEK